MILNYFNNPTILIISAVVMIMALIFHNIFQAWVASRYGDNGPRFSGYLRFDPQQHLEPFGVLFLFLLGFGWPKSIPVDSRSYRGRGRQEAVVWYSGPLAYLIVGFLSALIAAVVRVLGGGLEVYRGFLVASSIAVLHAVINIFPVYPLDGAKAMLAWGNADVRRLIQQIASFGLIGFILVFFLLSFLGITGALQRIFLQLFQTIINLIPGL
jgi:Zn-dependent protease